MPTFGGSKHSRIVSNFMCHRRQANPAGVSMSLDSTGQIGVRPGAVGCEEKQTRRMAWGMGQITWGFWEGSLSRQEREY